MSENRTYFVEVEERKKNYYIERRERDLELPLCNVVETSFLKRKIPSKTLFQSKDLREVRKKFSVIFSNFNVVISLKYS